MTAHDAKQLFKGACNSRVCQTVTAGIIVGLLGYSGIAVSSFVAETNETNRKVQTLESQINEIAESTRKLDSMSGRIDSLESSVGNMRSDVRDIRWHLIGGGSREDD